MTMTTNEVDGVSRKGLDSTFVEEERRKSRMILEANLLKAQNRHQEAADKFAEAARIEEELGDILAEQGLTEKYFVHRFSAASCWAHARNLYQAIAICNDLLQRPDLPETLEQRIRDYLQVLQARREEWVARLVPDLARL